MLVLALIVIVPVATFVWPVLKHERNVSKAEKEFLNYSEKDFETLITNAEEAIHLWKQASEDSSILGYRDGDIPASLKYLNPRAVIVKEDLVIINLYWMLDSGATVNLRKMDGRWEVSGKFTEFDSEIKLYSQSI